MNRVGVSISLRGQIYPSFDAILLSYAWDQTDNTYSFKVNGVDPMTEILILTSCNHISSMFTYAHT